MAPVPLPHVFASGDVHVTWTGVPRPKEFSGLPRTLTTSVTVTDSYIAGVEISAGPKGAIDIGASCSVSRSEAYTETLTIGFPIDCPDRVFWYPYMEVSRGECTEG